MAEAAFFLCSYEFAIKSENSPWCDLLDESDAQVRMSGGKLNTSIFSGPMNGIKIQIVIRYVSSITYYCLFY